MSCKGCEQRREALRKWKKDILKRRELARKERERNRGRSNQTVDSDHTGI